MPVCSRRAMLHEARDCTRTIMIVLPTDTQPTLLSRARHGGHCFGCHLVVCCLSVVAGGLAVLVFLSDDHSVAYR